MAIVGGGIAGLAAAYELRLRGLTVCLLEAADRPGGVINTERFDGWVVDTGPDSLLVQKPAGVALCRELGLEDRLVTTTPPRTAYVLRGGVLRPLSEGSFLGFPISFGALARSPLFSWRGKLRMACEIAVPRSSSDGDESIASFVRRRFGTEALNYLAEPLLAGIHAGDAERLSMRSLFPRLLEAEQRSGSVLRSVRAQPRAPSHTASTGAFVSLAGGIRELVDTLAAAIPAGTIRLSERVTELRRAGGFTIESSRGTVRARAVVLSVPAYVAAGLLLGIDTALAALCDAIPYASTATVAFGYRRSQIRHPLNGTGFVVPRTERSPLLAATWVTSKWPGRAPDGCALLRGFLGGGRDPNRLDRPDDELVTLARQALSDTLGIQGEPVFSRLYRYTRQSPQYEVGHLQRVATIEQRLSQVPGLFLAGSGFRAIGIPDCIADGREMAARAAAFIASHTSQPHQATRGRS
ncbi:MAG: protoporphyrinogen oxidase [Acidobacteria bacterium]|nr:protoporphyrinogen oxidase [Acidobacteriota bacterium]